MCVRYLNAKETLTLITTEKNDNEVSNQLKNIKIFFIWTTLPKRPYQNNDRYYNRNNLLLPSK
jgi:hypothetical protein